VGRDGSSPSLDGCNGRFLDFRWTSRSKGLDEGELGGDRSNHTGGDGMDIVVFLTIGDTGSDISSSAEPSSGTRASASPSLELSTMVD